MNATGWIITFFGMLVTLGGYMGYLRAQSLVSLVMGICFGILLIFSGVLILKQKKLGEKMAMWLCIALALFFGLRFLQSYKMMPAGVMLALSLLAIMTLTIKPPQGRL